MIVKKTQNITLPEVFEIIENVKNAELCRDANACARVFKPIWEDIEFDPDFDESYEPGLRAELLRLAGFFLSYIGKTKNKKGYQERGKNLLFRAIEIYQEIGLKDKAAEAKVMLALCYWYANSISECELILAETELEYDHNQLHPVYLQICINHLMALYPLEKYAEAFTIVEKIRIPMEICRDSRLQTLYHNQAGILYWLTGSFDNAHYHFQNAIEHAEIINSRTFVGSNLNNIANVMRDLKKYDEAIIYADQSIVLFEEINEEGWLSHILDTKASILLEQNKLSSALTIIDRSIEIFRRGDDYTGLAAAIFLRVKIKLKMDELPEALLEFAEVMNLAKNHIDEFTLAKYSKEFSKLFYVRQGLPYLEEVHHFQKHLLSEALRSANFHITKTAASLGVDHQYVSDRLKHEFPELYDELGFSRKSKSVLFPKKSKPKLHQPVTKKHKPIQRLDISWEDIFLPGKHSSFEKESFNCFLMNGARLEKPATNADIIVLCSFENSIRDSNSIVVAQNLSTGELVCATADLDVHTGIHFLAELETNFVNPISEYKIFGEIIGYCMLDEIIGEKIVFANFN